MRVREHGDGVRADLVRRIAVCGDAIGADDDGIECTALKKMSGHVVGDERDVDVVLLQLPRGESRTLQVRSRFIGEDGDAFARFDGGANDAEGGAVTCGGKRAGVAVRENRRLRAEEFGAEAADAAIRFDVFVEYSLRFFDESVG